MSISIQGLDTLITKLDKLSKIESKKIIESVGDEVQRSITNSAREFSQEEYKHIAKCESRDYGNSYYLDIGLANDKAPFEAWKGLWFHQWGYWNHGLNFKGEKYISMHQMWFDKAVQAVEPKAKRMIREKIREEFKALKK